MGEVSNFFVDWMCRTNRRKRGERNRRRRERHTVQQHGKDAMVSFDTLKRTAFAWQDGARVLICAANILLTSFERSLGRRPRGKSPWEADEGNVWRPMMVLYALAVENLLKAIIIARGKDPAPTGKLDKSFKTHNLSCHAARANLSFAPDSRLLDKLRDFIESGKYPIGKDPKSGLRSKAVTHPDDIDDVFALLDKLEDELRSVIPRGSFPKADLRGMCRDKSGAH